MNNENIYFSGILPEIMELEKPIIVFVSTDELVVYRSKAAEKLLKINNFEGISHIMSENAAQKLKNMLKNIKNGEADAQPQTVFESLDGKTYNLELRPCEYGVVICYTPCETEYSGMPVYVSGKMKYVVGNAMLSLDRIQKFLENQPENTEKINEYLQKARSSTDYIAREIQHMQLLSEMGQMQDIMYIEQVDIALLVRELAEKTSLLCEKLDISVEFSVNTPEKCMILCDEEQMTRAVLNLITNAVKAKKASKIAVSVEYVQNQCAVIVKNDGMPISKSCINEIGSPSALSIDEKSWIMRKSGEGAPGLGLSLVSAIAKAHSGTFKIKADEHHTTASILLSCMLSEKTYNVNQRVKMKTLRLVETELSVLYNMNIV